jgi:hypothetical protein
MDEGWPPAGQRTVELGTRAGTLRAFGTLSTFTGLDAVTAVLADACEVTLDGVPIGADRAREILAGEAAAILAALPPPPAPQPRQWGPARTWERITAAGLTRFGTCGGPGGAMRVEYDYHAVWDGDPPGGAPHAFVLAAARMWLDGRPVTDGDRARALAAAAGLTAERTLPAR